ncbi:DNA translocase FtsK [Thermanaerosceptrum fracticalcis]|uniref:DNA translocase FtsK n=1 Tax=Thermanaerosceptrum fracticalcis TaxID=1712410 RepID=A0A7G6E0V2_THEFR|nr:DNA translocase FtsK [Thermanaerosceptrum fracticalcis]QNB45706.1 DNA translocase FtsK [Thermanaerosceptrum fracticalcis]
MPKAKTLKEEIKQELWGITLLTFSFFIAFCLWQGLSNNTTSTIGAIGNFIFRVITTFLGSGKYLLPLVLFIMGISKIWYRTAWDKLFIISWVSLLLTLLTFLHINLPVEKHTFSVSWEGAGGGITGYFFAKLTLALFGKGGSYIFLGTCMLISVMGIAKKTLGELVRQFSAFFSHFGANTRQALIDFIFEKVEEEKGEQKKNIKAGPSLAQENPLPNPVIIDHIENNQVFQGVSPSSPALVKVIPKPVKGKDILPKPVEHKVVTHRENDDFKLPPIDLLQIPTKIKSQRLNKDITDNVRILEETLENFGVKARVTQVSRGPAITRYEIQPPPGVKVSRIVNLADDIALSLAAPQVRIEAPIPGKAAVGIEVPNEEIATVSLREVLETTLFQDSQSKLTVALGKDIAGNPIVADLGKMPHLLIAGATGSGKSVCMNALIASILFKSKPDEVKLLMIDPKVVELSTFNGIPHLISPVVTDPKKAATALRWAVHEMENRYELFAGLGVKDITRYNLVKKEEDPTSTSPALPYVVVLIDELADLMMVAPADVEDAICRLAQMARAAGIHLVVATQRPSVDVITGVIKANIPSRIAFAVSSQTDSRTILDMGGAERLLGRGDMLFYPTGMAKPIRVQGVYVSDQEIESLVEYLKIQKNPEYLAEPWQNSENEITEMTEEDELLAEAAKIFIESGQASISLLQRRLRIGYTRAARIIDQLEERGIVGGYEGSKPRAVRMTWEEYEKTFGI